MVPGTSKFNVAPLAMVIEGVAKLVLSQANPERFTWVRG
jgi:hypothetical protein